MFAINSTKVLGLTGLIMKLEISNNRTILEVQHDFNHQYPFLKLEFYKEKPMQPIQIKEHLPQSVLLKYAGLKTNGYIDINNETTVNELEKMFVEQFGLLAEVSRNSGGVWLKTTMTNNWSLRKQNEYGQEIVRHTGRNIPDQPGGN